MIQRRDSKNGKIHNSLMGYIFLFNGAKKTSCTELIFFIKLKISLEHNFLYLINKKNGLDV